MGKLMIKGVPASGTFDKAENVKFNKENTTGITSGNVQGAIEELNDTTQKKEWNFAGQVSGKNTLNLPTNFNELSIYALINNSVVLSCKIEKVFIDMVKTLSNETLYGLSLYTNNGKSTDTYTVSGAIKLNYTNMTYTLYCMGNNAGDLSANTVSYLYYR